MNNRGEMTPADYRDAGTKLRHLQHALLAFIIVEAWVLVLNSFHIFNNLTRMYNTDSFSEPKIKFFANVIEFLENHVTVAMFVSVIPIIMLLVYYTVLIRLYSLNTGILAAGLLGLFGEIVLSTFSLGYMSGKGAYLAVGMEYVLISAAVAILFRLLYSEAMREAAGGMNRVYESWEGLWKKTIIVCLAAVALALILSVVGEYNERKLETDKFLNYADERKMNLRIENIYRFNLMLHRITGIILMVFEMICIKRTRNAFADRER